MASKHLKIHSAPVMILEVKMKITRVHFFICETTKNSMFVRATVSERGEETSLYTERMEVQIRTTFEEDNLAMTTKI